MAFDSSHPAGLISSPNNQAESLMAWRDRAAGLRILILASIALAIPDFASAADCGKPPRPGVDWAGCTKRNIILAGASLDGAQLGGADLTSTDLRGANLNRANLSGASLARAALQGIAGVGAVFDKANAARASFAGAQLARAGFSKAEVQRADFTDANLAGASFEGAGAGRGKFGGANISGANFRFADISRADFRNATANLPIDVTGAYMFRTRLEGFDLNLVKGIAAWQIGMACGDKNTVLPAGIAAPAHWPCPEQ
jgi:uncharacterized protein YjbI with pentapeptide repeats